MRRKLWKKINLYSSKRDEEKEAIVNFYYDPPQSKFWRVEPGDWPEVDIYSFTDIDGKPLEDYWEPIIEAWEKDPNNISDLIDYGLNEE